MARVTRASRRVVPASIAVALLALPVPGGWPSLAPRAAACETEHFPDMLGARRTTSPGGVDVVALSMPGAPAGQVSLRLVVRGGASLDPTDGVGLAHVVSHALWDSAMDRLEARANTGDTGAAALLRATGGRPHTHRGAMNDMFAIVFALDLADADAQAIAEARETLAEVAWLDGLTDEAIARAREDVARELRGWSSPFLRMNQAATRTLFEPLGVPSGPPVGREEDVAALTTDAIRAHAETMLRRGAVVAIVAGAGADADALAASFNGVTLGEPLPHCPVVVTPPNPTRALALQEPEATGGFVEVVRVTRGDVRASTPAGLRVRMVRAAAAEAFQRRIELASERAGEPLSTVIAMTGPYAPGIMGSPGVWLSVAHVMTGPDRWRETLALIAGELRRIEAHGFTDGEAALACARALRELKKDAADEVAGAPRDAATRLARKVALGESLLSAAQELNAARAALAGTTGADLRDALVEMFLGEGDFDERGMLALAAGVGGLAAPESAVVRETLRVALMSDPEAYEASEVEPATVESLFAPKATPRGIKEIRVDPRSKVLTMTLGNGVTLHHRQMGPPGGEVVIEATVGGGVIDETGDTPRGVTEAALGAWRSPATAALSSREIDDALATTGVRVRAWAEHDAVRLRVMASGVDAEAAVRLAAALLASPRVEPAAIERWRQMAVERDSFAASQPFERLRADLYTVAHGAPDQRLVMPTAESAARIDAPRAQAWLDRLLATGGVEIAIVGDVTRAQATEFASTIFGALPARPTVQEAARTDVIERTPRSASSSATLASLAPHAAALVGVLTDAGEGADRARAWALGEVTARALSPMVRETLRGDLAVSNEARALWSPMEDMRGFSLLYTPILAPPEKVEAVADAAWGVFERAAREGVSPARFEEARERARRALAAELEEPMAWAGALADAARRGRGPAALLDRVNALSAVSPDEVRGFLAWAMERGGLRMIVKPVGPE